jgi:hypothetical protein
VSALERAVDFQLQQFLPGAVDGGLSKESIDNAARLKICRVWIVDPLDGTREFTAGIPEWAISIFRRAAHFVNPANSAILLMLPSGLPPLCEHSKRMKPGLLF